MKRTQRKLSDKTRHKISVAMKGRKMSDEQKSRISESMKRYWKSIPYENNDNNMEEDVEKTD